MKKTILKTVFIFIFSFLFFACGQEENLVKKEVVILSDNEIHDLAIKHNEALNHVLVGLKNRKISEGLNEKNFSSIINLELNDYYKTIYNSENDLLKSADYFSQTEVSKYLQASDKGTLLRISSEMTPIESVIEEYKSYLSVNQITLLVQCDKALENASNDVIAAINELTKIQNSAKETLYPEEAQVIIIAAEIGKASLNYWNENFNEWQELIAPNEQGRTAFTFSWAEVAGADVAGGIGGAVGALAVNVIPGAGQVAYGGAIIGGAAGGSAADAAYQVWNNFF